MQPYGQGAPHPAYPAGHLSRPQRPGTLTGAAVIAFVAAGIELLGAIILMIGGSVIGGLEQAVEEAGGGTSTGIGGLIILLSIAAFAIGGVYIWGGVLAMGGKNSIVLFIVAGVAAALNLVSIISTGTSGWLGLVMAAVVIGLLAPASRDYVRADGGKTL